MIGKIKAIRNGNKLAKHVTNSTKECINYMFLRGCNIGTRETGFVLLEINAVYEFCFLSKLHPKTEFEYGLIHENSKEVIKDWLDEVWQNTFNDNDRNDYVNLVVDDIMPYYQNWSKEFNEQYSEYAGSSLELVMQRAIEKFMVNFQSIYSEFECDYDKNNIYNIIIKDIQKLILG